MFRTFGYAIKLLLNSYYRVYICSWIDVRPSTYTSIVTILIVNRKALHGTFQWPKAVDKLGILDISCPPAPDHLKVWMFKTDDMVHLGLTPTTICASSMCGLYSLPLLSPPVHYHVQTI